MKTRLLSFLFFVALFSFIAVSVQAQDPGAVLINGKALDQNEIFQLQQTVGAQIIPGNYWYDQMSGLWGYIGGPYSGQILPGLNLGGPLAPDASGGGTNVFINGREIHPAELLQLQRSYGVVNPGRYWLNAQGIGGYEGGPAQFNLMPQGAASQNGAGGEPGYNVQTAGGSIGSDGNCSYFLSPDGSSVSNC